MATGGFGNSGDYYLHFNDFWFQDEFQSLMGMDHENTSSSFTALLGLPPNKAMELLHHQDVAVPAGKADLELEIQGSVERNPKFPDFPPPLRFSPTFPSNMELVERAAKFSVFSADLSSPSSTGLPLNSTNNSSPNVKTEPSDSDSSRPTHQNHGPPDKSKVKSGGKKKKRKNDGGGGEEKVELPYIHVRARRGQATDSHSLAERARREKINARMKFLQELVPGCRKISGTALVLEEIINHVQSLQRQVEFLSMRLASVNPRIDYGVLDRFLAAEDASATSCDGDGVVDVVRRKQLEQNWQLDLLPPTSHHQFSSLQVWDRDDDNQQQQQHGLVINPGPSLFCFDSANSAPLQVNQLKMEM